MTRRPAGRSAPPGSLRRRAVPPDRLALVPASLLPWKAQWQAIANGLPAGAALAVVPVGGFRLRQILRRLVPALRARGRRVTAVPAARLAPPR